MIDEPVGRPMKCAACGVGLDQREDWAGGVHVGTTYFHGIDRGCRSMVLVPTDDDDLDRVGMCDFCSASGAPWTYPCDDFTSTVAVHPDGSSMSHGSVGAWGACDACHDLIEAGDFAGLAERALDALGLAVGGAHAARALAGMRALHEGFRAHRRGPTRRRF